MILDMAQMIPERFLQHFVLRIRSIHELFQEVFLLSSPSGVCAGGVNAGRLFLFVFQGNDTSWGGP